MNSNKQNLINKIRYRAQYRGTKEMDIFVNGFVNSIIDKLDIEQLKDLDDLVNLDDEKLMKLANQTNIKEENTTPKINGPAISIGSFTKP